MNTIIQLECNELKKKCNKEKILFVNESIFLQIFDCKDKATILTNLILIIMKKTLLIFFSLLMCIGIFAENIPFDQYGNVLLSDYENYSDNQVVKVTLIVNNSTSGAGTGWGIGSIKPINNSSAEAAYSFTCLAASATGEENIYEFTIAQFKDFAKVNGDYYTDTYGQKGITINVYNGATINSIVVQSAATSGASFDFESNEINDTYSVYGYTSTDATATVNANPTASNEKSLHMVATGYRTYVKFPVALPTGKTLSNIEKITFKIYFNAVDGETSSYPQNKYKNIDCLFGATGTSFDVASPTLSISNLIGNESNDTWISKVIPLTDLTEDVLALNTFDFGIGINHNKCDYYLDDIVFVEKSTTGINTSTANNLSVYTQDNMLHISETAKHIEICDLNGKVMLKTNNASAVDVASLPQGLYIAKIEANNQRLVKKFIK